MNVVSLTLYFLIGSMYSIYLNNEELEKASIDDNVDFQTLFIVTALIACVWPLIVILKFAKSVLKKIRKRQ